VKLRNKQKKKADQKIESPNKRTEEELYKLVQRQSEQDSMIENLRTLLQDAIRESRTVDRVAKQETLKENLIRHLHSKSGASFNTTAGTLVDYIQLKASKTSVGAIMDTLVDLKNEGYIYWEGELEPSTVIYIQNRD
jgi:hypothetical protein